MEAAVIAQGVFRNFNVQKWSDTEGVCNKKVEDKCVKE